MENIINQLDDEEGQSRTKEGLAQGQMRQKGVLEGVRSNRNRNG